MTTRKLAAGQFLTLSTQRQEKKEKALFRHHMEILGNLLQSDIRYSPSYKMFSPTLESTFSGGTPVNNNGVWSKDQMGIKPLRLLSPVKVVSSVSRHENTPRSSFVNSLGNSVTSAGENQGQGRRRYWRNPQRRMESRHHRGGHQTSKMADVTAHTTMMSPGHFEENPNSNDSFKSYLRKDHPNNSVSKGTRSRSSFSDEEPGTGIMNSGCGKLVLRNDVSMGLGNSKQNSQTFNSIVSHERDSGTREQPMYHGGSTETHGWLSLSRHHNFSLHCEVLGPLACKFCTRHLSITNASMTLSLQSDGQHASSDATCPLCRAEQNRTSSTRYRAHSSGIRHTPKLPYCYTPLDLYMRVRNRKLSENINNIVDSDSISVSDGEIEKQEAGKVHACAEVRSRLEGSKKDEIKRGGTLHQQENSTNAMDVFTGGTDTSLSSPRVNDGHFEGMRVTVRYLNNNHENILLDKKV